MTSGDMGEVAAGAGWAREAITNGAVRAMKDCVGRGPTTAKTYLFDDYVVVVMRDALTVSEKGLVERGDTDVVAEFRSRTSAAAGAAIVATVQAITGSVVVDRAAVLLPSAATHIELLALEPASSG